MLTSRVDEDGRTTIPKAVRDRLHLDVGDLVEWEVYAEAGSVVLHRVRSSVATGVS